MPELEARVIGEVLPTGEATVTAEQTMEAFSDLLEDGEQAIKGRLLMDYGDSGDGKSTRMHSFARYYYLKTGLPVRLVSSEDSSKMVFQDLIDAGIVEAVFLPDSKTDLSVYERIAEGEWPIPGKFTETKTTVKVAGKDTEKIIRRQIWQKKSEWEGKIGAYIFEGLSSMCENMLDKLTEDGRFQREQKDAFEEGGRAFSPASQTSYGFTQKQGIKILRTSGALPVERVGWTAHEAKGKDEFDGTPVRGPKLVGNAATNTVRKYVGVLLHSDRVKGEHRVYFDNHADQTAPNVQWKAKTTSAPSKANAFHEHFKGPYFVPKLPGTNYVGSRDGLIPFLELEEEIRSKSHSAAAALVASKG